MEIKTDRLTIRRIAFNDWKYIQAIWNDQKNSVYARFDKPNDTEDEAVKLRIQKWASFSASMDHMFFAICMDENVIGYIAFNKREGGYEIGYCFLSDYHGNGYATESICALILYVQDIQSGTVITARTALENTPSVKLLKSLGFTQVGSEPISFYKDENDQNIYFEGGIFQKETQ